MVAEGTSLVTNLGTAGVGYINGDLTVALARLPVDDWVGVQADAHWAADGVAVGTATLFDHLGAFGTGMVTAVGNPAHRSTSPTIRSRHAPADRPTPWHGHRVGSVTMDLLLGIDMGTGSTKGVLVDADGSVLASETIAHAMSTCRGPGGRRSTPKPVVARGVRISAALMAQMPAGASWPGMCVSGVGPCLVLCDDDLRPLRPAILYGVDTRASAEIESLTAELGAAGRSWSAPARCCPARRSGRSWSGCAGTSPRSSTAPPAGTGRTPTSRRSSPAST